MNIINSLCLLFLLSSYGCAQTPLITPKSILPTHDGAEQVNLDDKSREAILLNLKRLNRGDTSLEVVQKMEIQPYSYTPMSGKKLNQFFGFSMRYTFFQGEGNNLIRDKIIYLVFSLDEKLYCVSAQGIPNFVEPFPCFK